MQIGRFAAILPGVDRDNQAIRTRAFHISYALMRLSRGVAGAFSAYFETYALDLMDTVVSGSFREAMAVLDSADYALRLANEIGVVGRKNFDIVQREIGFLKTEFADLDNSAIKPDVDLSNIFTTDEALDLPPEDPINLPEDVSAIDYQDAFISDSAQSHQPEVEIADKNYEINSAVAPSALGQVSNKVNPEMRQAAILDRIRQKGYCRLKDIQESFPDTSERTLRYDLQHLIAEGLVERIGSGGPASFYRVRRDGGELDEVREV